MICPQPLPVGIVSNLNVCLLTVTEEKKTNLFNLSQTSVLCEEMNTSKDYSSEARICEEC